MNINRINKKIDNYKKLYRNSSAKEIVKHFMFIKRCKLASYGEFDTIRITLNDMFNVSEENSRLIFNKILMDYDIEVGELARLKVNGGKIFVNAVLGAYHKYTGETREYTSIYKKLEDKVNKFKYAKKNGIYDGFSYENYLLLSDDNSGPEIINEEYGSYEFIILCDLIVSYLDNFNSNSSEFGFEKRRFDLHHYKGNQNELALIYYNTYNKLEKENSKEYNSKNISFVKYIRDSLFLFTTESNPYSEFNPNNKTSYENSCQSIRVQAKGTSKTKSTNDIKGYEGSEEYFLAVLKEHNLINLRE